MKATAEETKQAPPHPGVVHANAVYALDDFMARMRIGESALRTYKRKGLKISRPTGMHGFIVGQDFIEFLAGLDN